MNTNVCTKIFLLCCMGMVVACSSSRVNVAETTAKDNLMEEASNPVAAVSSSETNVVDTTTKDSLFVEETRTIEDFHEIFIVAPAKISFYQKEGAPSLTITGKRDLVDIVRTDTENGVLKIYPVKDFNGSVNVELSAPSVEKITIAGVGAVTMENSFVLGNLDVSIFGIGAVIISRGLVCDNFTINHAGAGSLYIRNVSCNHLWVDVSRFGYVNVSGECRTADLRMSGSGLIDVSQLEGSVNTELIGGGSITTSEGTITKTEGFSVEGLKDTVTE